MILFLCRSADHKNLKTLEHKNIKKHVQTRACLPTGHSPANCSQHRCIGLDCAIATRLRRRRWRQRSKGLDHPVRTGLRSLRWNKRRRSPVEALHQQKHEKKAAKHNVQKNPTTNPKQAARAHKNNLLLYQITSYAAYYWSLVSFLKSHNVYSRRLFSKNNKQRKKLRRLLCRKNKERNKLRRLLEFASRSTNQRQKLRRSYNAHRQTRAHMHFLWHDGFFNVFLILGALYVVLWTSAISFLESHWRWLKMALVRLGKASKRRSNAPTQERTIMP